MRGLSDLRALSAPPGPSPLEALEAVGKTLRTRRVELVAKRATPDTVRVRLDDLNVEHAYQRPVDREKLQSIVAALRTGAKLAPIEVNRREDGSLWIVDGQHRALARAALGQSHAEARLTDAPSQAEPSLTHIMAKVDSGADEAVALTLLGCGARHRGKQLILSLGDAGQLAYTPHAQEFVGKSERGALEVRSADALATLEALSLAGLCTAPQSRA